MSKLWLQLRSIRGQLVFWYLGLLAVLLLALGVFQWFILGQHLRSSLADSLRDSARSELAVLGPCYIRSSGDLQENAFSLARLLGSRETAVTIVTPTGSTLASHGAGPPGASKPLQLSKGTVLSLIRQASLGRGGAEPSRNAPHCVNGALVYPGHHHFVFRGHGISPAAPSQTSHNLLLVAVPLGPMAHPVGYAILGNSLSNVDTTIGQVDLIFALGAASALVLALLVGLPIVNRGLAPLRRVTATAEAIAAGDLAKRANLPRRPDEVGRLGMAFDTMVDRLQSALSAATTSEERMRRFLADASHELRTPATVLRGASQVLLRHATRLDAETVAGLRDMHEEAVRLSRLVDDLLTLSRIDAGQSLAPERVQVRPFLQSFLDRYGDVWPTRTLRLDTARVNGASAYVDPEALRRMLTNLVENAARYSHPDGAITLEAASEADRVAIGVSDEGPGLSPEDAQHVFDRFYRANKSRSRDSGGTGLGLSIVCGLVERSAGDIAIDTGPNRGTTVTITLPSSAGSTR